MAFLRVPSEFTPCQAKRVWRQQHRPWGERKARVGQMVQMGGSPHEWSEGRRPKAVLMVMAGGASKETKDISSGGNGSRTLLFRA